jgi:hypothetical protein
MSAPNQKISTRHGLGYLIMACTIVFPTLAYFEKGSSLFGEFALAKLLGIAAIGGAITGALFAKQNRWLIGCLTGALAGAGAAAAVPLYVNCFHRQELWKGEFILVLGAGALPGFLLGKLLMRSPKTQPLGTEPLGIPAKAGTPVDTLQG